MKLAALAILAMLMGTACQSIQPAMESTTCQTLFAKRDSQITSGMTESQVSAVLGAPNKVVTLTQSTYAWDYDAPCGGNGPSVEFNSATRLTL